MKLSGVCIFLSLVVFSIYPTWDVGKKVILFWMLGGPILASLVFLLGVKRTKNPMEDETSGDEENFSAFHRGRSRRGSQKEAPYVSELAKYYRDFLETSFHKRREPKQAIRYRHQKNYLIGFNAKKYESLFQEIWTTILEGFPPTNEFTTTKGKFVSKIPSQVKNLISQQIAGLHEESIQEIGGKA